MRQPGPDFRPLHHFASLARGLFVVGFGVDVVSIVGLEQRKAYGLMEGGAVYLGRVEFSSSELFLLVASVCALLLSFRRAAFNARAFAPPAVLRDLSPALLLPWNPDGRRVLHETWIWSVPPPNREPPVALRLLWWLWSCWAPAMLLFLVSVIMLPVQWSQVANLAIAINAVHAAMAVSVVIVLGRLAKSQDARAEPAPAHSATQAAPRRIQDARPAAPQGVPAATETMAPDASSLPAPGACPGCGARLTAACCTECGVAATAAAYRIVKVLGATPGRRTYLALAPDGKRVTLKEIALATAEDASALDAFQREARLLFRLHHSRIPPFVDAFTVGAGPALRFYLAHRFVEGRSLEEEIGDKLYTEQEVLDAVGEILRVLVHLQSLAPPVFHRDVKPANIIRRRDGILALVDFGVARERTETLRSATMVGSVGYMPPEQLGGQVDRSSDPYAAGATALQMLTHRQPWEFMDGPILRLPRLPISTGAQRFLQKLVAASPRKRFPDAAAALSALEELRGDSGTARKRMLIAAVALLALSVAGGIAAARVSETQPTATRARHPHGSDAP